MTIETRGFDAGEERVNAIRAAKSYCAKIKRRNDARMERLQVAVFCVTAIVVLYAASILASYYTVSARVVSTTEDVVVFEVQNGHQYEVFADAKSFETGDIVVLTIDDNGTETKTTDDKVVNIRR